MKRDDFIKTYLEGAEMTPFMITIESLIGKLYDARKNVEEVREEYEHTIEFMDDVARNTRWTMKCRSCEKDFEPDCELSEMFGSEVYCGGSDRCCP